MTESPALGDAVVVTESGARPYGQVVTAGGHQLTADDPADADDCVDCETRTGQLDHIERELQFDGELTEERRVRLLNIAGHCLVHRMLNSEVHITTTEDAPL